jgi:hypothetical protein
MDDSATFVVRLARSRQGRWAGVVERVRTGEKYRVKDIEAIGPLIAKIVEETRPQADSSSQTAAESRQRVDT